MKRPIACVAALVLAAAAGCGEGGQTPRPAFREVGSEVGGGIQWVDGWSAGLEQARASGKAIFVYVGRHSPP